MPKQSNGTRANGSTKVQKAVATGFRGIMRTIGTVLTSVLVVMVITGCIVASVLTVYVLRTFEDQDPVSLESIMLSYTTILYAQNGETGEDYELMRIGNENCIWVEYSQMPKQLIDAVIAVEDKRFMQHQGVDIRRSAAAFVNMFIPIMPGRQGGSTLTQQLIKNVTNDKEQRIDRKVREIFRALNLEQRYSKEQILESYLNTMPLGNNTIGIQAAANLYLNKDVSQLTAAESAALVCITKAPTAFDPFINPDNNKERQEWVLTEMHDQGKLTDEEYKSALDEPIHWVNPDTRQRISNTYSYFDDYVIAQVISDLMDKEGYTYQEAEQQIYSGGYRIYTTVDEDMQKYLENFYLDVNNFPKVGNAKYPQSAFVVTDTNGKILALAGGIGEKEGARVLNRATDSFRDSGSTIKPIAAYAMAFEHDLITWSTKIVDEMVVVKNNDGTTHTFKNYTQTYSGPVTVDTALQRSINIIPIKLTMMQTPDVIFNFLHDKLDMYSLVPQDIAIAPMAIGSLTKGVSPLEMAGAYQIYANGGYFTKPYAYSRVLDRYGNTVLEADTTPRRVISFDTATVINKLMGRVVFGPVGTGGGARLGTNMPQAGKTGTSDNDKDQWFIGITPYYVGACWLGYDKPLEEPQQGRIITATSYAPPVIWRTVMGPLLADLPAKPFPASPNVKEHAYCMESGELAIEGVCPDVAIGWYKESAKPPACRLHGDGSFITDWYNNDSSNDDTGESRHSGDWYPD